MKDENIAGRQDVHSLSLSAQPVSFPHMVIFKEVCEVKIDCLCVDLIDSFLVENNVDFELSGKSHPG